jgi:hypothetical protein
MQNSIQGSSSEWIDILKNYSTISDCEKWWEDVNRSTWLADEAKALRRYYFRHIADIEARLWREKPIDRSMPKWCIQRAEEAVGTKGNIKAVLLPACPF